MSTQDVTQVRLIKRPEGNSRAGCFAVTHDAPPPLQDGEVQMRMHYVSVDPAMTGWMADKRSYMPPVGLGEVMRAFGVGEVLESRSDKLKPGDFAMGFTGAQSVGNANALLVNKIMPELAPLQEWLSGLGWTGYTAYFGLTDVGQPKAGETLLVSAAAGAVGSMVGQIGKILGLKVVGIAGGPEKCRYITEELGFDAAIDYKNQSVSDGLKQHFPKGVDLYFDNVGGEILDTVLGRIRPHARIVLCGAVSQYDNFDTMVGPGNYMQLITQSGRMQGFTMKDYLHRIPEAVGAIAEWKQAGKIQFKEHILDGLEKLPEAFEMLLRGENQGKLMLKVD